MSSSVTQSRTQHFRLLNNPQEDVGAELSLDFECYKTMFAWNRVLVLVHDLSGDLDVFNEQQQTSEKCGGVLQIATQARQVLALCEQKGTDKVQLEYDPRNPFDICSLTFTPIYRQDSAFLTTLHTKQACMVW